MSFNRLIDYVSNVYDGVPVRMIDIGLAPEEQYCILLDVSDYQVRDNYNGERTEYIRGRISYVYPRVYDKVTYLRDRLDLFEMQNGGSFFTLRSYAEVNNYDDDLTSATYEFLYFGGFEYNPNTQKIEGFDFTAKMYDDKGRVIEKKMIKDEGFDLTTSHDDFSININKLDKKNG